MIIERQRNLAAAAGSDEYAQPCTPSAAAAGLATFADGPAFNRMPSLLKQPLPQRGFRFPASTAAAAAPATESQSAPLNPAAAAAAARRNADEANLAAAGAALARTSPQWNSDGRLSGSFRQNWAPRVSFELDVYGGYTSALAFPDALDAVGTGEGYGVLRVMDDDTLAAEDGVADGQGGVPSGRQMQQQSSFQDNTMRWFV
jgi:hypothetical protein